MSTAVSGAAAASRSFCHSLSRSLPLALSLLAATRARAAARRLQARSVALFALALCHRCRLRKSLTLSFLYVHSRYLLVLRDVPRWLDTAELPLSQGYRATFIDILPRCPLHPRPDANYAPEEFALILRLPLRQRVINCGEVR